MQVQWWKVYLTGYHGCRCKRCRPLAGSMPRPSNTEMNTKEIGKWQSNKVMYEYEQEERQTVGLQNIYMTMSKYNDVYIWN